MLDALDSNGQLSFISKEEMATDGTEIYVEAGDLFGSSGNGIGYVPQTDV